MANLGLLTTKVAPQSLLHHSVLTMYYHTDILVHFSLDVLQLFEHACMQKSVKQNKKKTGFFVVFSCHSGFARRTRSSRARTCVFMHMRMRICVRIRGQLLSSTSCFCFQAKPQLPEFDWTDCTDLHKRTFCVFAMFYQPLGREAKITWFS